MKHLEKKIDIALWRGQYKVPPELSMIGIFADAKIEKKYRSKCMVYSLSNSWTKNKNKRRSLQHIWSHLSDSLKWIEIGRETFKKEVVKSFQTNTP